MKSRLARLGSKRRWNSQGTATAQPDLHHKKVRRGYVSICNNIAVRSFCAAARRSTRLGVALSENYDKIVVSKLNNFDYGTTGAVFQENYGVITGRHERRLE